jgi:16S rRNA processing protein RimM
MIKDENLVELGVSNKPHGIKGGFLFKLHNTDDSILAKGVEVYLFPFNSGSSIPSEGKPYKVESIHFGNKTICYLKGVKDRNIVEEMLPFLIMFPRDQFPDLETDEWYVQDLIGLTIFDQDGYEIGKVDSYYENGAQVVLKMKVRGKNLELPFVESFFPYLDIEKNKIVLIEPEYD